jgi:tetratricopeptide (TPR) repeat protein
MPGREGLGAPAFSGAVKIPSCEIEPSSRGGDCALRLRVLAGVAALVAVLFALSASVASSAVPQEWAHRHSAWIWSAAGVLAFLSIVIATTRTSAQEKAPASEVSINARDISGTIVVAQSGAIVRIEGLEPSPPPAQRGAQIVVGELPGVPPVFVQRDAVGRLAEVFADGGGVAAVSALTGGRGTGKTQVAAQYAREAIAEGIELVAWISADDESRLLAGLAEVAHRLDIADQEGDSEASALRLRDALAVRRSPSVLVLDNATHRNTIWRYLPATGATRVIITSTDHAFSSLGTEITVDKFDRARSLVYLRQRTGLDDDGANKLADELGDLPLALAQAATVIKLQGQTYEVYLKRLRELPMDVTLPATRGDIYPHGVAHAVALSVQAIEDADESGLTRLVLATASLLDASGVSRHLLAEILGASSVQLDETLAHLVESSLMVWGEDRQSIVMHRLIARAIRDQLQATDDLQDCITATTSGLQRLLPDEDNAWEHREDGIELLAQTIALWENTVDAAADHGAMTPESLALAANLALWTVRHLIATADFSRAIEIGASVLLACEKALGPDHPDTLASRNNLAGAYASAGHLEKAIPLYEDTLGARERVLGPDHPDTLSSRNNLAAAQRAITQPAFVSIDFAPANDWQPLLGRSRSDDLM